MYYKNRPMIWSYDFMYIKYKNMYHVNCKGSVGINEQCKTTIMNNSILNGIILLVRTIVVTYQTHASKDGNAHGFHTHVFNKQIK